MRLPSRSQLHKIRQTRLQLAILNPLFPASGLATGSFNGLHLESKFLADKADGVVEFGGIVHRERVSLKKSEKWKGTNFVLRKEKPSIRKNF